MSTKPGSTFLAMADTSLGPEEPEEPDPEEPEEPEEPEPPEPEPEPNEPVPPDDGVELPAAAEEAVGLLLVQATWPMAAPATNATSAAAPIIATTRRPCPPEVRASGGGPAIQPGYPGFVGGGP